MGDIKGFLKFKRQETKYRPVCTRLKDYREVVLPRSDDEAREQASRCMDCGTSFCHWGCPIGNYIPEWNDLVYRRQWKRAFQLLDATNNFPEITGRLCPAICEYACVLGINDDPVAIRENELSIIEYGFDAGFIRAMPPKSRTGKKVAVIGSGPAGLTVAAQLNKAGHNVVVFERDRRPGGIMRYGIPDFKLEKWIIDRRLAILEKEGIEFVMGTNAGLDYKTSKLIKQFDVICLSGGSRIPRDLKIEGRDLKGIYFAMDYLVQSNRRQEKEKIPNDEIIDAKGKRVVVIGGGDTGADCVGTAHRQGASCVIQIEVMPKPATCRTDACTWPKYPLLLKTSTSHEEGGERQWSVLAKKFIGKDGCLEKLSCVRVEFVSDNKNACPVMRQIPGSEFEITADMAILAIGFLHPEKSLLTEELNVKFDERGNVKTDETYMTETKGVFSAGDMHRGQSLIVWAIAEGRAAAHSIDKYLMGTSNLPAI
ncbi:MAG: glutamate synthase subunit beta [Candidatus Omnitrophica bacterium]|nr:glutamate synthase subunit beta [Candidatus Omnitrophota bacterium]